MQTLPSNFPDSGIWYADIQTESCYVLQSALRTGWQPGQDVQFGEPCVRFRRTCKLKFALEQAMKTQTGNIGIALLFL